MTLRDTLYKIESQSDGKFELLMLDGHPVYEGHFPGQPITPGVLTLAMVRQCAETLVNHPLKYTAIKNCRFVSMVRPCERLTLDIELQQTDKGYQITANLSDRDNTPRLQLEALLCDQRTV